MKKSVFIALTVVITVMLTHSCNNSESTRSCIDDATKYYPNLLKVIHTPLKKIKEGQGYFTDCGSWMGFTIPEKESGISGFCGPFDLDHRRWISASICNIDVQDNDDGAIRLKQDTAIYYPGKLIMELSRKGQKITQELVFVGANHALLKCSSEENVYFVISGELHEDKVWASEQQDITAFMKTGEVVMVTFPNNVSFEITERSYSAKSKTKSKTIEVLISYFNTKEDFMNKYDEIADILTDPKSKMDESCLRWNTYIKKNIREDMPESYNRVMVKSIMTLMSNWRTSKKGLLYDGIVPSHAVDYFVGFWAWDSWKHAVAISYIDNELAKDQIRTMFCYQDDAGMVADCIYTDPAENNFRDTKPPLAGWAVNAIFQADKDTSFVAEIYPKLLKYHQWRYGFRDHDRNGVCEYGSTDGTLEAAKWESGMDNAIRFDNAKMVKNSSNAWSMDQESVDLNAYLQYEREILKEFATILNIPFDEPDRKNLIKDYFFDKEAGYFFDRTLDKSFVKVFGPEGWTPLWTELATQQQADRIVKIMFDLQKFSTYIPFPTVAADNPEFDPRGYWRGPIWIDQVYFAISGIRKYGYEKESDIYTRQLFDRLQGLEDYAPIHENYDVHTGERLKAPHFSWSAAHLFLLYKEYGQSTRL